MLTVYRRHLRKCKFKSKGRAHKKCSCPLWVDGILQGKDFRAALKTRNWELACDKALAMEAGRVEDAKTIKEACDAFNKHIEGMNLSSDVVYRYKQFTDDVRNFAARKGFTFLKNLDVPALRSWQSELDLKPTTTQKRIERFRTFMKFCVENGWIGTNPASLLKPPKTERIPTLPFTDEEWKKILKACDEYPTLNSYGYDNRARMRAFVLLLRYSGLRFGDAFTLHASKLDGSTLMLRTEKTGTTVRLPLPKNVIAALNKVKQDNGYYFYSGNTDPKNTIARMGKSLRRLFKLAGVDNAHAHRMRDTFAVSLLLKGVPLEDVSILLGHKSIRVTERHYAPFVKARQDRLEKMVRSTWN